MKHTPEMGPVYYYFSPTSWEEIQRERLTAKLFEELLHFSYLISVPKVEGPFGLNSEDQFTIDGSFEEFLSEGLIEAKNDSARELFQRIEICLTPEEYKRLTVRMFLWAYSRVGSVRNNGWEKYKKTCEIIQQFINLGVPISIITEAIKDVEDSSESGSVRNVE